MSDAPLVVCSTDHPVTEDELTYARRLVRAMLLAGLTPAQAGWLVRNDFNWLILPKPEDLT